MPINWEKSGAIGQWVFGIAGVLIWWFSRTPEPQPSSPGMDWKMLLTQWGPPLLIALAIVVGAALHLKAASIAKRKQLEPPSTAAAARGVIQKTMPQGEDFLDLTILSADWGNARSRKPVADIIGSMPRNALMFLVNPDAFRQYDRNRADPAFGDEKYLDVGYSYSGSGPLSVRRKQGEWIILPEDPTAKAEIQRLTGLLESSEHEHGELMRSARTDLAVSGACELLAEQAWYLRAELNRIIIEDQHDPEKKGWEHPLDRKLVNAAEGALWSWQHRAWSAWQSAFWNHRNAVIKFRPNGLRSPITDIAPEEKETAELGNRQVLKALEDHQKALAEAGVKLLKRYDSTGKSGTVA